MIPAPARPTSRIWFLLLPLLLLALACDPRDGGRDPSRNSYSGARLEDAAPRRGGVLRLPIADDPGTLNPLLTGPAGLPEPGTLIYPVLLNLEPRGAAPPRVEGGLARAWSWSPEQRTLTCTLQPGWLWEDTLRVTVSDVVRTYDAYRAAGWLARRAPGDSVPDPGLVSVAALDDETVRLTYGPGVTYWRALPAAGWPVLPARKLADLSLPMLRANSLGREPLSASSFRLADWRPGLNLWLEPNPTAYGSRQPYVERVEMDVCPGIDARILRVRLGRADLATGVPVYRLDALLEGDTIPRLHHDGIATVEMLCWNEGRALFRGSMRRAVSLAINRERITRELLTWNGIACGGPAAGLLEPRGPVAGAEESDPDEAGAGSWLDSLLSPEGGLDSLLSPEGGLDSLGSTSAGSDTSPGFVATTLNERWPAESESVRGTPPGPPADTTDRRPESRDALPHFDPQEANRLLDLAGWSERGPDGIRTRGGLPLRVEMIYERDHEFRERLAALLESDLAQVGIDLAVKPVAGRGFQSRFRAGLFETALMGFRPPAVPDVAEVWASWGYWNGGRYASLRVDSLSAALRREESPREVERLARRIESVIRREAPATFLVYREWTALLSPRVRGFQGTAADPLRGLERVWLGDSTASLP